MLLTMIPKTHFTQNVTCFLFCGSASHFCYFNLNISLFFLHQSLNEKSFDQLSAMYHLMLDKQRRHHRHKTQENESSMVTDGASALPTSMMGATNTTTTFAANIPQVRFTDEDDKIIIQVGGRLFLDHWEIGGPIYKVYWYGNTCADVVQT